MSQFESKISEAAAILGLEESAFRDALSALGAETEDDLVHVTFQDLTGLPQAGPLGTLKPIKVRKVLDLFRKESKTPEKAPDLLKDLKDEAKLWALTDGHPLICETGGTEHSAANIRYYKKTGTAPKMCLASGCQKLLSHVLAEVSFEDGSTFLSSEGLNPLTGRDEGRFPLADRALAFLLMNRNYRAGFGDVWGHLDRGTLRIHFKVAVAEIEAENLSYANVLRKPFSGVKTSGPTDPFYRSGGHKKF